MKADYLPSLSEVEVPELKISSIPLLAASIHLGKFCDEQCKEFMLCNSETNDPRICLESGKEVTACAFDFFRKIKKNCQSQFESYYTCLNKYGGPHVSLYRCRKLQSPFDDCVKEHLGQDRPRKDYFNRIRVHSTNRPRHVTEPAPMPEALEDLPDFSKRETPKEVLKGSYADDFASSF